jgi:hemerythrin-like domain-containing protein
MANIARLSQDDQSILCALEVLRLMTDRIESNFAVEVSDIQAVLHFLNDIGQYCLDNTEKTLLVPAMTYALGDGQRSRVDATVATHHEICELLHKLENSLQNGVSPEFIALSRRFTTALSDLIYFEHHHLTSLIEPFLADEKNGQLLVQFHQAQEQIAERTRREGTVLHQLELKYIDPHCI